MGRPSWKRKPFDLALSFAGENRTKAEELLTEIRQCDSSVRVFYDKEHAGDLAGERDDAFAHIYGPGTRFVAPLVSASYRESDWAQYEFGIAREEERKRGSTSIIPIRLDSTRLVGLPSDKSYLSTKDFSIAEIAEMLVSRVKRCQESRGPELVVGVEDITGGRLKRSLLLLHTATVPLPLSLYEEIDSEVDWRDVLQSLDESGTMLCRDEYVEPIRELPGVAQEEIDNAREQWIDFLRQYEAYPDLAELLAFQLFAVGRLDEAVEIVHSLFLDPFETNFGFADLLIDEFVQISRMRQLPPALRPLVLHAASIRYLRTEDTESAVREAGRLLRLAKKDGDRKWEQTARLIRANAKRASGNTRAAVRDYESLAKEARESGDTDILSNCLNNIAIAIVHEEPQKAIARAQESRQIKHESEDRAGEANSSAILALAEQTLGNGAAAVSYYAEAIEISEEFCGERYTLRLKLDCIHCRIDLKVGEIVLDEIDELIREADSCGASDIVEAASNLKLRFLFVRGGPSAVREHLESFFRERQEFASTLEEAIATHALAITQLSDGDREIAGKSFARAYRLAMADGNVELAARCTVDRFRATPDDLVPKSKIKAISKRAHKAEKDGNPSLATELWTAVALQYQGHEEIENADHALQETQRVAASLEPHLKTATLTSVLATRAELWRGAGELNRCLEVLLEAIRTADRLGNIERLIEFRIALASELVELGDFDRAEHEFETVFSMLSEYGLDRIEAHARHNYGEQLRRSGLPAEALTEYESAIELMRGSESAEQIRQTEHSLALARAANGDPRSADRLLTRLFREADVDNETDEAAWHLLGRASIAAEFRRPQTAIQLHEELISYAAEKQADEERNLGSLNLAYLLRTNGRSSEAIEVLERERRCDLSLSDHADLTVEMSFAFAANGRRRKSTEMLLSLIGKGERDEIGSDASVDYFRTLAAVRFGRFQNGKVSIPLAKNDHDLPAKVAAVLDKGNDILSQLDQPPNNGKGDPLDITSFITDAQNADATLDLVLMFICAADERIRHGFEDDSDERGREFLHLLAVANLFSTALDEALFQTTLVCITRMSVEAVVESGLLVSRRDINVVRSRLDGMFRDGDNIDDAIDCLMQFCEICYEISKVMKRGAMTAEKIERIIDRVVEG